MRSEFKGIENRQKKRSRASQSRPPTSSIRVRSQLNGSENVYTRSRAGQRRLASRMRSRIKGRENRHTKRCRASQRRQANR